MIYKSDITVQKQLNVIHIIKIKTMKPL